MERERRGLGNDVAANLRGKKHDHVTSVSLPIYLVDRGAYRVSGTPRNLDYLTVPWFGSFQDYGLLSGLCHVAAANLLGAIA